MKVMHSLENHPLYRPFRHLFMGFYHLEITTGELHDWEQERMYNALNVFLGLFENAKP